MTGASPQAAAIPVGARRVRVAFALDSFDMGGTELNAVRTAELLDRTRFDVSFVAFSDRGPLAPRLRAAGIPIHLFPLGGFVSRQAWRTAWRLRRHLRDAQVDVLHAHDIYSNIFAVPCARLAGVPMVIASRRWWHAANRRAYLTVNRGTYHLAHRVLANSDAVGRLVVAEGMPADRVMVIPNFVEAQAFEPPAASVLDSWRAELGIARDDELLGIVANLHAIKDQATLLRAMPGILAERPRARLVLVGEGDDRPALEGLAQSLGIAGRVTFAGRRPPRPSMHWMFQVSLLSSTGEGFPNSVVEAMAAGRPLVATAVGGVPDVVDDGATGFLVPPASPDAITAQVLVLLRDPALAARMGEAGRARAHRAFHADAVVRRLEATYVEFLSRTRVGGVGVTPAA